MSVMFKSVAIALPKLLRSWDVGSLVIDSISSLSVPSNFSAHVEITLGDVVSKTSTAHAAPSRNSKGKDTLANAACSWMLDPPVRLPVYHRYSSAAIFSIKSHDDIYGESVLWLTNIVDKDKTTLRLPIYSERLPQLRQNNYSGIPPIASVDLTKTKKKNKSTTSLDHSEVGMPMPTGSLEVQLHFEPGLSSAHQQSVGTPPVETDEGGCLSYPFPMQPLLTSPSIANMGFGWTPSRSSKIQSQLYDRCVADNQQNADSLTAKLTEVFLGRIHPLSRWH